MRLETLFIIAGFLGACNVTTSPDTGNGGGSSTSTGKGEPVQVDTGGDQAPGCGTLQQTVTINGHTYIEAPVPCNPNYRDHGDPPPDSVRERKEQVVDPSPEMVRIQSTK